MFIGWLGGGYTQSDEMTMVISSASVVRGEQQCHSHDGRVVKLCSLTISAGSSRCAAGWWVEVVCYVALDTFGPSSRYAGSRACHSSLQLPIASLAARQICSSEARSTSFEKVNSRVGESVRSDVRSCLA